MLSGEELGSAARMKGLSLPNAEKDYLQEVILFSAYSLAGRALVFKGGTCLYKCCKLNRFSEDLDFTLGKKTDMEKLAATIVSDLGMLGIKSRVKETREHRDETTIRLLINGPLCRGSAETQCFIPLNISKREPVLLEPKREPLMSLYREIPYFEMFIMQEAEILAEKARAILTRMKPRDVYDLWFLLARRGTAMDLALIDRKLAPHGARFEKNAFLERIARMEGMWKTDLAALVMGELPPFDAAYKEIKERIGRAPGR